MSRLYTVFTVLCVATLAVFAQGSGKVTLDKGMRYIVAFAPVTPSGAERPMAVPLVIGLLSDYPATVRIRCNSGDLPPFDRTVTLTSKLGLNVASALVAVPVEYMVNSTQQVYRRAFEITSDVPISVFTRESWAGNGEESSFLPVAAWGTEYTVVSWACDRFGDATKGLSDRPGFAVIVASEDNTQVTITPTTATEFGLSLGSIGANQSVTITLNAYEVFMIQSKINAATIGTPASDLSGTLISSTKPVAVISGHTKGSVLRMPAMLPPSGQFSTSAHFVRNNLHENLLPDYMAGVEFVVAPTQYSPTRRPIGSVPQYGMSDDRGDAVRIVSLANNTVVQKHRADGSGTVNLVTLQKGMSFVDSTVEFACVYITSQPALLYQYGKSYAKVLVTSAEKPADGVQGYPSVEAGMPTLMTVPPVSRWVTSAAFEGTPNLDNSIAIVFPTAQSQNIFLDGVVLTGLSAKHRKISGTPYSYVNMFFSDGAHVITTSADSVRFMAWFSSSLDGLNMGRANARALGVSYNVPGSNVIEIANGTTSAADSICGTAVATATVTGSTGLSMIHTSVNTNYLLRVDSFLQGAFQTAYTLTVIDKSMPAQATVRVVSRSGEYVEESYSYQPQSLTGSLLPVQVVVSPRAKQCVEIDLVNPTNTVLRCTELSLSNKAANIFSNDLPVDVPANSAVNINACITGVTLGQHQLDVFAVQACHSARLGRIGVTVGSADLTTTDAIIGNVVPNSSARIIEVEVKNPGAAPLLIDGIDRSEFDKQAHFTLIESTLPILPVQLGENQLLKFSIRYNPNSDTGLHETRIVIRTNSLSADSIILCSARSSWTNSVDEEEVSQNVVPHPVPISGFCTVTVPINVAMRIVDIQGRVIADIPAQTSPIIQIHPSSIGMSAGTYYITTVEAEQRKVSRLVVE